MSSWLSNAVKAVKKGVVDTGHTIGKAQNNPWVKGLEAAGLAATGVGAPAAAALMGGAGAIGGLIRPGGGLKGAITEGGQGALTGALAGTAGGSIRGALKGGVKGALHGAESAWGLGNAAKGVAGGGAGAPAGAAGASPGTVRVGGVDMPAPSAATLPGQGGGGGQNILGDINDYLTKIPGVSGIEGFLKGHGGDLLGDLGGAVKGVGSFLGGNGGLNALGVAQGLNAANLGKQSTDYANKAVDAVQSSYDQRAPLRSAGLQGMLNPAAPDLSSLTANSGPYGKALPSLAPTKGYTQ